MTYNFDEDTLRRGTGSYKWDSAEEHGVLPMWVADMDFQTAPAIIEALRRRVDHGIFGYTKMPHEYYDAVTGWFARRHGWHISPEWFIYTSGVVPAVSAVIKALAEPGDKVMTLTPAYNCFFSSIRNNGCVVDSCPLIYKDNAFTIDFDALNQHAADPKARLLLLCNPHNPSGRVWTRQELMRIADICGRNGVTVVSDEIHCELTYPGHRYTPFGSLPGDAARHSVSCISPSKAFNIAGLQIANIIAPDADMRRRIDRAININEVCDVNPFGIAATIAAYNEGEEWLDQLRQYLRGNYELMLSYCREHLPQLPIAPLEGTYLAWMDCRALDMSSEQMEHQLLLEEKLWLNAGTMYGAEGEGFMRWNLACQRSRVEDGLNRFRHFALQRLRDNTSPKQATHHSAPGHNHQEKELPL